MNLNSDSPFPERDIKEMNANSAIGRAGKAKEMVDLNSDPPFPERDLKEMNANSSAGRLAAKAHRRRKW